MDNLNAEKVFVEKGELLAALYDADAITMKGVKIINQFPAADVSPVVRCRDCKHAWIHPCGYAYCHRDGRNAYEMTFDIDSFCNYGERKDNG